VTAGSVGAESVGRDREIARIATRLAEATEGRGGVVLVSGEPGIGKTRLALDASAAARAGGCRVAWGRCPEGGAAPAFWPWVEIVREVLAAERPSAVRARLGPAAGDVLALAGARDLLAPGTFPADLVASQRFRVLDGLVRLLADGAAPPWLAVVEDLHRADDLSVAAFRHVAVHALRLPVLLVVTVRPADVPAGGPLVDALAEVGTMPWSDDVPLSPLSAEDAARLVEAVPGSDLGVAEVEQVVARAGGNPLFLQQLALAPGSPGTVPLTLQQVIRARVRRLPPECRALLDVLAVAGRAADLDLAAAVVGLPGDRARAELVPALGQGLLLTAGGRSVLFSHALVQETLYADLDPVTRAGLHERFAETLQQPAADDPALLPALADHVLRAVRGGRPADCVPAVRAAAAAAAGRLAFGEAARWLGEALDECAGRPAERTAVLLDLGLAEVHAGRTAEARRHLEEAADLAAGRGDAAALAAAALGVGSCVVPIGEVDHALVARLRQAVAELGAEAPAVRVRLLARLAVELYWGDGAGARRESASALAAAEGLAGDPGTLAEAVWARLFTLRGPDRLEERLALGRRLVDSALRERDEDGEVRGRVWWLPELLRAGQVPAYRANVERLSLLARRTGQPLHQWYAQVFAAQRDLLVGDAEAAAHRSAAAGEIAGRLGIAAGRVYLLGLQVPLRRDVGGLADLREPLQEAVDRYPALVTLQMMLALVDAETGSLDQAAAGLARLAPDDFAALPPDSLWTATVCLAAEVAGRVGDVPAARSAARLLEPHRGTCAVQGVPVAWGAVDRAVGLARLACGDEAGAVSALTTALGLHQRWGFVPLALRTRLDLAVARGMDADSRQRVRRAGAEARALGLRRLADDADVLLLAAGPPRIGGPGGRLSPREVEVLRLLAEGVSNAGIAARLVLSVNTVERHVRNVYIKLGVANRAEAAAVAARHDVSRARSRGGTGVPTRSRGR
jgi:DNA-binding CsgD family transcriptional regulator